MKQYAVVSDLLSGDTFGYIVKSSSATVCYGMSSKGHAWAHEFNSGETDNIFDGLPSGVEIGRFGPLTKSAELQLHSAKKSAVSKISEAPFYVYGGTEAYDYVEEGPQNISVKETALVNLPDARRYDAINFKALSFRADLGRTNFMAKTRFHHAGIAYGSAGISSKSLSESHFQISTGSTTYYRRAVADLVEAKGLVYDSRPSLRIEEKKLGRSLRRAGRFATARFDPNAIDGDEDGLVQEGTPFERPATPRTRGRGGFASGLTSTENQILKDMYPMYGGRTGPYARPGDDKLRYEDDKERFLEDSDRDDWDFDSEEYRKAFKNWLENDEERAGERQDERRLETGGPDDTIARRDLRDSGRGFASSVGPAPGESLSAYRRRTRSTYLPGSTVIDRYDGEHVQAEVIAISDTRPDWPEDDKLQFTVVGNILDPETGEIAERLYDPKWPDSEYEDSRFETIDDAMEYLENIEWHGDRGIGYGREGYQTADSRRLEAAREARGFASADKPRQKQAKEIADVMDDVVAYTKENSGKRHSKYSMLRKVGSGEFEGDESDVGKVVYGPDGFGLVVEARSFDFQGDGYFEVLYTHDGDGNRLDTPELKTFDYDFNGMADTADPAVQAPIFNEEFDILEYPDDDENFIERLEEQWNDHTKPFGESARRQKKRNDLFNRALQENRERRREGFASATGTRRIPRRSGTIGTQDEVAEWIKAVDGAIESQVSQGLVGNIGRLRSLRDALYYDGTFDESSAQTRRLLDALQGSPEFYDDERLQALAEAISNLPRELVDSGAPETLSYHRSGRPSRGRAFAKSRLARRGIANPTDEQIEAFLDAHDDLNAINLNKTRTLGRSTSMDELRDLLDSVESGAIDMPDVLDIVFRKNGSKRKVNQKERDNAMKALSRLDKYFDEERGWRSSSGEREGMGSRTRAATTQRAATPRTTSREGFASAVTGRTGGAGTARDAGRKSVDARDGQYAADLDEQQMSDLKDAILARREALVNQLKTKQKNWSARFTQEIGDMTFADDEQLAALDKLVQKAKNAAAEETDPAAKKKKMSVALTYQRMLDDFRVIKGMEDSNDFSRIEHLTSTSRQNVVKGAKAANSSMPALKQPRENSTVFGYADGFTNEEWTAEVSEAKRASGSLGRLRQRAERRIFEWDDRRYSKRKARKARRQGRAGAGSFGAEDERGPGLVERGRRKVRRAVRRALRSRKGEAGLLDNTVERDKVKSISFDGDNPRLGDLSKMGDALRTLRRQDGGFKKATFKGTRGEDTADVPSLEKNMEAAVIGQAQDMHATPALVSRSEFDDLVEQGWAVLHRGFGGGQRGRTGSQEWLENPKRRISDGEGGELKGPGEYWGRAYGDGRTTWRNFLQGEPSNLVVLVPPNARRVDERDLNSLHGSLRQLRGVWSTAKSEAGGDSAIKQTDKKELAEKMRDLLNVSPEKDSYIGKVFSGLIDQIESGNDDAIDTLDLLDAIGSQGRDGPNFLGSLLGYDVIDTDNGTTLVLNRGAMIALDQPINKSEVIQIADRSDEVIKGMDGPVTSDPMKGGSKRKGKKIRRGGEEVETPDNEANAPEGASADSVPTSTPTAKQINNMKVVPGPTGSNPAEWREDANGKKYLIKTPAKPEQADNEAAVATIYNMFGVGAPTGVIEDGGTRKPVITGLDLRKTTMTPQLQAEARKHMGLDMLLSNWDVRPGDNVVLDANGNLVRVDAGGGGMFRARGGDRMNFKPGGQWIEPASMLASGSFGQQLYGTVTNGDMVSAMQQVQGVDIGAIDAAMQKAGVSPEVRKLFRDVIQERKREAVRLEAQFAAAPANATVVVDGTGSDARVAPGS